MELFWKISAVCVLTAVLCLLLRRYSPESALVLSMICAVLALAAALGLLSPVLSFLRELRALSGMEPAAFAPLLKTVAIGILTQITGAFCLDAGEQALCRVVELCGTILAAYCALPLAELVLELLRGLMGG